MYPFLILFPFWHPMELPRAPNNSQGVSKKNPRKTKWLPRFPDISLREIGFQDNLQGIHHWVHSADIVRGEQIGDSKKPLIFNSILCSGEKSVNSDRFGH